MTQTGIEPQSPGSLVSILTIMPTGWNIYIIFLLMPVTVSLGRPYACNISFLYIWKQLLWRYLQTAVLPQDFLPIIFFMIQWIVRICDVMDWFLWKPFRFFLRIFLTSGWIWLRNSYSNASVILSDSKVAFLGEWKNVCILYCVLFIDHFAYSKKYGVKFSCLPLFRRYFVKACSFSPFNFFQYSIKLFFCKQF